MSNIKSVNKIKSSWPSVRRVTPRLYYGPTDAELKKIQKEAKKKMDKESRGRLYLVGIKNEQNKKFQHVKLGYTTNSVKARKNNMQTSMPSELYVIYESICFPYAKRHENHFHGRLENKKVRGEWFKLTKDEICSLIDEIKEDSDICFNLGERLWKGEELTTKQGDVLSFIDLNTVTCETDIYDKIFFGLDYLFDKHKHPGLSHMPSYSLKVPFMRDRRECDADDCIKVYSNMEIIWK